MDLKAAGLRDPLLIGESTSLRAKLKVAVEARRLHTIGIDLVASCANGLATCGAKLFLFWDIFSTGALEADQIRNVVEGIAEGCRLVGVVQDRENTEMHGYGKGELELAGFSAGAVERSLALPRQDICSEDVVLGLASSGLHVSGFSLVRRIAAQERLSFDEPAPFDKSLALGDALLTPTRLYCPAILETIALGCIKAVSTVASGGIEESFARMIPEGFGICVDTSAWILPPVFRWLAEAGHIAPLETVRTFNCGIGMVLILAPQGVEKAVAVLNAAGEKVYRLGVIEQRLGIEKVVFKRLGKAWPC